MVINAMTKDDYPTFSRLSKGFYASGASLTDVPEENFKRTFNACLSDTPFLKGYLIMENGEAAGYILLTYTWYCEYSGETVTIDEIFIDEKFRGLGLGTKAIKWVFDTHKDYHGIQVEVKKDNTKASQLYHKLGFEFIDYIQMVAKPENMDLK